MAFRLPRLPAVEPPWSVFQLWWQKVIEAIERQEAGQDETIARIRRNFSNTDPTTIFTATENGVTATITIAAHARVYGDATRLDVAGTVLAGLTCDTAYAVYYDDPTLEDATPSYVATTVLKDAQFTAADGRHFCGIIITPVAGSGTTREGGGVYPAGSNVGGEIG